MPSRRINFWHFNYTTDSQVIADFNPVTDRAKLWKH